MKKKFRIKKSQEIQKVIQAKITVGNRYFILYYMKNHDYDHFRCALSVPKKYGNAVERNLLKRRIREIVRANTFKNEYDFFIVARTNAKSLKFSDIKENLEKLFAQANILGA